MKKCIKKPRHHFADRSLYGQSYGFSSNIWLWELDHKEGWVLKNWCFWIVLEKTLESPLDSKEIKQVHPKGNQSWIFIGRTDAEAEALTLWLPDVKSNSGKHLLLGKIEGRRRRGRQRVRCSMYRICPLFKCWERRLRLSQDESGYCFRLGELRPQRNKLTAAGSELGDGQLIVKQTFRGPSGYWTNESITLLVPFIHC